jgi:hypothetical protein
MTGDTRDNQLSLDGQRRRDTMRTELRQRALEHHAHRKARRRAAQSIMGLFLVAITVWGAILATSAMRTSSPKQPIAHIDPKLAIPDGGQSDIRDSQPTLINITRVSTTVDVSSVSISDEELLEMLAKMGRRTGIAHIDGKTILTQPVTDKEIARAEEEPINSF